MLNSRTMCAAAIVFASLGCAQAETTCASVRTDLTGQNIFGTHTMKDLSQDASAGSCDAAAFLARRAKDAQGFLATNCPSDQDLRGIAADMLQLGEDTLNTPHCED